MIRAAAALVLVLACGLCRAENYSDLWWNPAESGWGLTLADHGSNLFGVWYTYRADGKPVWYTIPGGTFSSDHRTFSGDVYLTHGPSYTQASFDPSKVSATKVGTATLEFGPSGQPAGSALFTYSVNGVAKSVRVERQSFGNAAPQWGADFTDLWYNPAESGWGLSLAQHGNNVFGVWYTYDTDGQPLWFVMPGVQFTSATTFNAKLYTTSGPYYGNAAFDPSAVQVNEAGSAVFSVSLGVGTTTTLCDAGVATFTPAVNTPAGVVQYQRSTCTQPFGNSRLGTAATTQLQPKTCAGSYTLVATEPSGCMAPGTTHTFSGSITLTGIDWTRAGHQSGTLTLTDVPYLFMPIGNGSMMGDMMMGMGMDTGATQCIARTLPLLTLPLDFTLAHAVQDLSTSGSVGTDSGQLSYDIAVTPSSIAGHVSYSGGAFFTDAFTAKGSFSCSTN